VVTIISLLPSVLAVVTLAVANAAVCSLPLASVPEAEVTGLVGVVPEEY
jgi:hypothetical protein